MRDREDIRLPSRLPPGMSELNPDDELWDRDALGSAVLNNHHRLRGPVTVVPEDTSDL